MKKYLIILLLLSIFSLVTVANTTSALSALAVQTRHIVSSGTTSVSVDDITLNGTLGQPLVGIQTSGETTLGQGFWNGVESFFEWLVHLPLVVK